MPSPHGQSSPSTIPYGPSKPLLETITSPIRDTDTGGVSFHKSLPRPPPATLPRSPTKGVAEEPLTLTDTVVLFAKRIKKLESKLKAKKRKLVLSDSENEEEARQSQVLDALLHLANAALHDPSDSITPSKPANQEQSSEQEIGPTTFDAVLTLSKSKARARAATIIYKCIKKQQSSSGLDFTDAAIPTAGLDSAGGLDSGGGVVSAGGADIASGLTSTGISVAVGPTVSAKPSSPIRDPDKGKAVATPSSLVTALTDKELADQHAAILEAERQELLEQELKQSLDAEQVYLDMDQVRANPTLSAELLGADVSEDTFSIRMVELMNQRRKAIAKMKAKAKRDKPMTPAQQKEFMRTFNIYDKIRRAVDLATANDHHQHLNRSGETLESLDSKKLKSSYSTKQPAELQETTSISGGATIAAGDPIPAVTSVSAASFVPAGTPIAVGVSTTASASGSASEATVPIIELLDSPSKDTSIPMDLETEEQDVPLRKSSRKKSIARRRSLPSAYKLKFDALPFDEDDPEVEFKKYLRQVSDDDEPVEPVSLALVSDIRRADLMVLYGMVLDKYKIERATETEAGDIIYMFVDKKYPLTPETIQRMLHHGLEIDRDSASNDLTTAIQLI
nr:hypothetical protein [Tanacetum cinerariifolium]